MSQKSFTVDSGLTILNGNIVATTANSPGAIKWAGNSSGDNNGYTTMELHPDTDVAGDAYLILDPTAPNHIHIRAGGTQDDSSAQLFLGGENSYFRVENGLNPNVYVAANTYQWKFDNTGVLTVPSEGVIQSLNDTVILQSVDTITGNTVSARLGTDGALYLENTQYPGSWLNISTNTAGDANIIVPSGNINITPAVGEANGVGKSLNLRGGNADQSDYYTGTGGAVNIVGGFGGFNDGGGGGPGGNVNITAGVSSDPAGVAGNVNITSGTNDWVFDYTGNLTAPGNISLDGGRITGGTANVVTDGINSIALAPGAQMDLFGFPFTVTPTRGQLTITNVTTPSEANGTWYYQSVNNSYTYQIYTDSTYSTLVDASGWSAYTGGGSVAITLQSPPTNIVINSNGFTSTFANDGSVDLPGDLDVAGNISGNTSGYAIGYRDIPQVSFTGDATIATTDAGKHYYSTESTDYTLTIANNASQGFQVGTAITVINQGTGNITVAQDSGVTLYLAGNATSGNRSVATFGMATLIKVATNTWFINGTGVS